VRAVIADDTVLFREGLARLLTDAGIDVVGEAGDGDELVELAERERPDLAIVDIRMPPTHRDEGIAAAETIRRRLPEVSVLVLSQYVEASYALRLISDQQGHCGYLLKDRVLRTADLVDAVERVTAGELVVDRALVDALLERRRAADPLEALSAREREVLALMAEGLTDRGIAERLWITPATVETHVRHILQKLSLPDGAANNRRVQAVLAYLRA
jgi:DNA-binding NarL/FixJ family response regulator